MTEEKKDFVLEYSLIQKVFHINTIDKISDGNLSMVERGLAPQYFIIYGPDTYEKILAKIRQLKRELPVIFK